MNSTFLRELWRQAEAGVGVVPERAGFYEPLCAIYPVEAASHAVRQIISGSLALQSFVRPLSAAMLIRTKLAVTRELVLNLNTPAELHQVVRP